MDFSNIPLLPSFLLLAGLILAFYDRFTLPNLDESQKRDAYNGIARDLHAAKTAQRRNEVDLAAVRPRAEFAASDLSRQSSPEILGRENGFHG